LDGTSALQQKHVEQIIAALNANSVRYLIAGGLAVVAHGYVRFTADVDLIIQLEEANVRRAISALATLGYRPRAPVAIDAFADPATRKKWITEKGMTVFSLYSPAMKESEIDIFVEEPLDFEKAYGSALQLELAPGVPATFVSRQDLIDLKTKAGRPEDSIDLKNLQDAWDRSDG
jgi:hypothetical protein